MLLHNKRNTGWIHRSLAMWHQGLTTWKSTIWINSNRRFRKAAVFIIIKDLFRG